MPSDGGQLTSLNTQYEYDQVVNVANGAEQHLLLGLHSDGAGNWEYSDGSAADMEFLREHSNDNLVSSHRRHDVATSRRPLQTTTSVA